MLLPLLHPARLHGALLLRQLLQQHAAHHAAPAAPCACAAARQASHAAASCSSATTATMAASRHAWQTGSRALATAAAAQATPPTWRPCATRGRLLAPQWATGWPVGPLLQAPGSVWDGLAAATTQGMRHNSNLSRKRVPKSAAINDTIVSNKTDLKYGAYGIRAVTGKRVAANTIEAVRRTLVRRIKRTARLWIRVQATVPVTKKPLGIRMGKGKGSIEFYACPVRPGQIIFEMDRVPRKVAMSALAAVQPKWPGKLAWVEWS